MSGSENYTRAIEFRGPQYLPCALKFRPERMIEQDARKLARIEALRGQFPNDLLGPLDAARYSDPIIEGKATLRTDEWGTTWRDKGLGGKTESYPLIEGYDRLASFPFPDPHRPGRFDKADLALQERDDRYVQCIVWFTLFERLWMLRGFENMLVDPYVHEKDFVALRDRIVEYNLAIIDQWIARDVDAVFFSDDWGCQRGLLMNPDDWRRLYKPSYARIFERVRAAGAHVWMHLCGDVTAILPDLIDIGLNVLNPVQPQAMDVRLLSKEFGGKVCFNGGVDVQGTMIHGKPADVRREVYTLVDLFGRFDGGYIGGTSHTIMPETPLDNVIALYEAFFKAKKGS